MQPASIVIIVPFYNRKHTIFNALESVKAQTIQPQQLVVVDDGSTDGGSEAVNQWISQNHGIINCRFHRQAKSAAGAAAARNSGLKLADPSNFIAFLDSDDIWPPDFLERTHHRLSFQPMRSLPPAIACLPTPTEFQMSSTAAQSFPLTPLAGFSSTEPASLPQRCSGVAQSKNWVAFP